MTVEAVVDESSRHTHSQWFFRRGLRGAWFWCRVNMNHGSYPRVSRPSGGDSSRWSHSNGIWNGCSVNTALRFFNAMPYACIPAGVPGLRRGYKYYLPPCACLPWWHRGPAPRGPPPSAPPLRSARASFLLALALSCVCVCSESVATRA